MSKKKQGRRRYGEIDQEAKRKGMAAGVGLRWITLAGLAAYLITRKR